MKIETTYNVGDALYIFTKKGLEMKKVSDICIRIDSHSKREYYSFDDSLDTYSLDDIKAKNWDDAQKVLKENGSQLQLLLY